jgi:hypothetical protein
VFVLYRLGKMGKKKFTKNCKKLQKIALIRQKISNFCAKKCKIERLLGKKTVIFCTFLQKIRLKTQDSRHKTQDTRLKTQDSRHKTQDTRLKTQDSRHKTQDTRPKTKEQKRQRHKGTKEQRSQEQKEYEHKSKDKRQQMGMIVLSFEGLVLSCGAASRAVLSGQEIWLLTRLR